MAYWESNGQVIDDFTWPIRLWSIISSWICYLATIANY